MCWSLWSVRITYPLLYCLVINWVPSCLWKWHYHKNCASGASWNEFPWASSCTQAQDRRGVKFTTSRLWSSGKCWIPFHYLGLADAQIAPRCAYCKILWNPDLVQHQCLTSQMPCGLNRQEFSCKLQNLVKAIPEERLVSYVHMAILTRRFAALTWNTCFFSPPRSAVEQVLGSFVELVWPFSVLLNCSRLNLMHCRFRQEKL